MNQNQKITCFVKLVNYLRYWQPLDVYQKTAKQGWEDASVIKSTGCSGQRTQVLIPTPTWWPTAITPGESGFQGNLMMSSDLCRYQMHLYMQAEHPYTYNKSIKLKKIFKESNCQATLESQKKKTPFMPVLMKDMMKNIEV